MVLKAFLWLRGLFNVGFGLWLYTLMQTPGLHGYQRGGGYALIDGLFGIAIAVLLGRRRLTQPAALAGLDGVLRLSIGVLILSNPGMDKMVLASLFFIDCVALAAIGIAAVGLISFTLDRRSAAPAALQPVARLAIVALCACTLLLGVGLMLEYFEAQQRLLLSLYTVLMGVLWCVIARVARGAA